jgi:hypothetical protein
MCVRRYPSTSPHHHGDFYEKSKEAQTSIDGNMLWIVIIVKALRCKHFDSCTHCGEENIDVGEWNVI